MSGLKINFHNNEVYCLGVAKPIQGFFDEIFTCKSDDLSIKYLGIPIKQKILNNNDWDSCVGKTERKLGPGTKRTSW